MTSNFWKPATYGYKGLQMVVFIWIIFGLWQLHIDLNLTLHRFLLLESRKKAISFRTYISHIWKKNRDGWIKQVSTLQTRHVLLCSYSLVKTIPQNRQSGVIDLQKSQSKGKSLQFTRQQVEIYNSCIKRTSVAILKINTITWIIFSKLKKVSSKLIWTNSSA